MGGFAAKGQVGALGHTTLMLMTMTLDINVSDVRNSKYLAALTHPTYPTQTYPSPVGSANTP